jgi:hypothetical protein
MIKKFKEFINEEVSGTEIPQKNKGSYFGPSYGDAVSPNTINAFHTSMTNVKGVKNKNSNNELTSDIFTIDDYKDMHVEFLKAGGSESDLTGEKENDISIMSDFLNNK